VSGTHRGELAIETDPPAEAYDSDPTEWSREITDEEGFCRSNKDKQRSECELRESLQRNKEGGMRLAYIIHYHLTQ